MKTIFSMIGYYFLVTFAGAVASASVYMICCDLTLLVCGQDLQFFNGDFFIRGLIATFPLVVSVVLGLLIFYGIRHSERHFTRLFTFIGLGVLTWLVLIPASFDFKKLYEKNFDHHYEVEFLSSGLFRQESGGVFYFSRVSKDGKADGLFIDLTGITGEKGKVVRFTDSKIDEGFIGEFADTLIRDAIKLPFVIVAPLEIYTKIIEKAELAWDKGYICWIVFCTFALALLSVISFQYVSVWRLINGLVIALAAGIICLINYIYYCGIIFKETGASWAAYFKNAGHTFDDPLLALINFIIFVLLLAGGILLYVFHGRKAGGDR